MKTAKERVRTSGCVRVVWAIISRLEPEPDVCGKIIQSPELENVLNII
jgi:hypothetical protein